MDKRAVGWNDGAGHGVDWFAVDEMVGDFPSPRVHPAWLCRRVCRTTPRRVQHVRMFKAKEKRQRTERWTPLPKLPIAHHPYYCSTRAIATVAIIH